MVLSEFFSYFVPKALLLAFLYFLVLLLVALDLRSGISKAKRNKEHVSSRGLRQTMRKLATYLIVLISFTIIDAMQMLGIYGMQYYGSLLSLPVFPVSTFIVAIFTGIIELKSIYENADQKYKQKIENAAKSIKDFVKWIRA